jgi:hypothetical protein
MFETSIKGMLFVLSHWLGLVGEGFNLVGALIMALDIFLRKREHFWKENLDELWKLQWKMI